LPDSIVQAITIRASRGTTVYGALRMGSGCGALPNIRWRTGEVIESTQMAAIETRLPALEVVG